MANQLEFGVQQVELTVDDLKDLRKMNDWMRDVTRQLQSIVGLHGVSVLGGDLDLSGHKLLNVANLAGGSGEVTAQDLATIRAVLAGKLDAGKLASVAVTGQYYSLLGAPQFADAEVPVGAINGINNAFTLASTPSPAASLQLFWNGVKLKGGTGYTLAGNAVTMQAGYIPQGGDTLEAYYRYLN